MSRIETCLARMSVSKVGPVRDLSSFVAVDDSCRLDTPRDIASSDLRVAVSWEVSVIHGEIVEECLTHQAERAQHSR